MDVGLYSGIKMDIENYEKYLEIITPHIDDKFEAQKEYIACKRGCSKCCKTTTVPFTTLEFDYLLAGYRGLDSDARKTVDENIRKLIANPEIKSCPFLVNDECSVYKYRGLICRVFGLLIISGDEEYTIPFCVHDGLNYANVYDEKTNKISNKKVEDGNFKEDPKFYPLNRNVMCNLNIVRELGLDFGESKPLLEWIQGEFDGKL